MTSSKEKWDKFEKIVHLKKAALLSTECSFLDGSLTYDPKQCGAYILVLPETKEVYVGSTSDLYQRRNKHRSSLALGNHRNKKLQQSYNTAKNKDILFLPFQTIDREMAFKVEQELLNLYAGNPKLLNIAKDAVLAQLGAKHSDETKEVLKRKMWTRIHHTDHGEVIARHAVERFKSEEVRQAQAERIRKAWADPVKRLKLLEANKNRVTNRPVMIQGVRYENIRSASSVLDIPASRVSQRIRSKNFPDWSYASD